MVIETGLSDFHQIALTIMKVFYSQQKANIIKFRDYQVFSNETFMNYVYDSFKIFKSNYDVKALSFKTFKETDDATRKKHDLLIKKYVRVNQALFINKRVNKEIRKRRRLNSKFHNTKSEINRKSLNKQRNISVSLI